MRRTNAVRVEILDDNGIKGYARGCQYVEDG